MGHRNWRQWIALRWYLSIRKLPSGSRQIVVRTPYATLASATVGSKRAYHWSWRLPWRDITTGWTWDNLTRRLEKW